jgi:hypothetical protein
VKPPDTIPPSAWRSMPLAKRKLLLEGPLTSGHGALISAVTTLAFELRLQGLSQEATLDALKDIPFVAGKTPERKVRKQIPAVIAWVYRQEQRLSGCPETSEGASKMRDSFSGYCDAECQASCRLRRAVKSPEALLAESPYGDTLESLLWMSGRQGGLGEGPKRVWVTMAAMAVVQESERISASTNYLTHRLGGTIQRRTLARNMQKLRIAGLLVLVGGQRGTYEVPMLSSDELRALETRLGVDYSAKWNRIEASHDSLRKAEEWPTWDVFKALNPEFAQRVTDGMKSM